MSNKLGPKLVAVMDINTLKLYQTQGLKVTKELGAFLIHSSLDHNHEKHEGFYQKKSTPSSFYDPHSATKDIEYRESAKNAVNQINKVFFSQDGKALFPELYIIATAKMLGYFKQSLSSELKKSLSKEIVKDLVGHNVAEVEKALFG
ncbi:MAG: hypothetical protein Tsb006_3300 [Rickettsiaceae bacterium]